MGRCQVKTGGSVNDTTPEVKIPDDLIHCGTCQTRCGTIINPDHFVHCSDIEPKYLCSCDKFCNFYGDCCKDFQAFCSKDFRQYQDISKQYPFERNPSDFICMSFNAMDGVSFQNLVIDTCSDGSKCEFTTDVKTNVDTFLPLYDVHRGIHYVSRKCAICNGVLTGTPWTLIADCLQSHPDYRQTFLSSSIEKTEGLTLKCNNIVTMYSPSGVPRPCLKEMKFSCHSSCQNKNLSSLCTKEPVSLTSLKFHLEVYKNEYCAMCNGKEEWDNVNSIQCTMCNTMIGKVKMVMLAFLVHLVFQEILDHQELLGFLGLITLDPLGLRDTVEYYLQDLKGNQIH